MRAMDASPQATPHAWSKEGIAQIDGARRADSTVEQTARIHWRDRCLMAMIADKRAIGKADGRT
jgi:hypothetical protein